jgi:hypothetical protein
VWRTELYLHPGDWVPYVAAAVLGAVILLAGVVFGLNEREKVSLVFRLRGDITLTDAERRRDGAEKSATRYQLPGIVDHVD